MTGRKIGFKRNSQAVNKIACPASFLCWFIERMADRSAARIFVGMNVHV
jgi:hypothetical protein